MPISELEDGRAGGLVRYGQELDHKYGIIRQYVERMEKCKGGEPAASYGEPNAELHPNDYNSSVSRTYDAVAAQYLAFTPFSYPIEIPNINLPDVLNSLYVVYNTSKGEGTAEDNGEGVATGSSYSISLSVSSKANSSLSIVADVVPQIQQTWGADIPAIEYYFFVQGNQTRAGILTRLGTIIGTTVLAWPLFHPVAHTISAQSGQVSISSGSSAQQSVSVSDSSSSVSKSIGTSKQLEQGASLRITSITPTLHGALTIGNPSESGTVKASSKAVMTGSSDDMVFGDYGVDDFYEPSTPLSVEVFPKTLGATTPSDIPRSGLYLYRTNFQEIEDDILLVVAQVIDASVFQLAISDLAYATPVAAYTALTPIEPNVPSHTGGSIASYSISPSLTTGLSFSTSTGIISGTPGTSALLTSYTITATNALGSTNVVITIVIT